MKKKRELKDIRKQKVTDVYLRSRARRMEKGETLQKSRQFSSKIIPRIKLDNSDIILTRYPEEN